MSVLLIALLLIQAGNPIRFQTGFISGQIHESDGNPAAGVRVAVTPADRPDEILVRIGETDASGRFRLDEIPPGRYLVTAGVRMAPTYYPGVKDAGDARIVVVSAGSTVSAIDFQLVKPTTVRVRAHVNGVPAGAPAGLFMGMLISVSDTGLSLRRLLGVDVLPDGSFVFEQVTPGLYEIGVFPANGSTRTRIEVRDKDIESPPIRVDGGNLWGRTTIEEGGEIPGLTRMTTIVQGDPISFLTIQITPESGPRGRGRGSYSPVASVRPNGLFRLQLPAGGYRVSELELPMGFTLKTLTYGSVDLLNSPFQVSEPPSPKEMQMTVARAAPAGIPWRTIRGRIEGPPQNRTLPVWVDISGTASATHGAGKINERRRGEVQAQPDGAFEITGVPPGSYAVRAFIDNIGGQPIEVTIRDSDVDGVRLALGVPPEN
jgi:hypothetical protein